MRKVSRLVDRPRAERDKAVRRGHGAIPKGRGRWVHDRHWRLALTKRNKRPSIIRMPPAGEQPGMLRSIKFESTSPTVSQQTFCSSQVDALSIPAAAPGRTERPNLVTWWRPRRMYRRSRLGECSVEIRRLGTYSSLPPRLPSFRGRIRVRPIDPRGGSAEQFPAHHRSGL